MNNSFKAARIISNIFIPPTNHIVASAFIIFYGDDNPNWFVLLCVVILFGAVIPLTMFFCLRRRGKIVDSDATVKEERTVPYFISIFIYAVGTFFLYKLGASKLLIAFWICYSVTSAAILPINCFWKISAHSMGIAGPIASLYFLFGKLSFLALPLAFLVMWSRLRLKVHDFMQVATGFLFGYFLTFYQIKLILNLWK